MKSYRCSATDMKKRFSANANRIPTALVFRFHDNPIPGKGSDPGKPYAINVLYKI